MRSSTPPALNDQRQFHLAPVQLGPDQRWRKMVFDHEVSLEPVLQALVKSCRTVAMMLNCEMQSNACLVNGGGLVAAVSM